MRIPMKGVVGSLNAAVAGSILLFEALAQRDPNAAPRAPLELPDEPAAAPETSAQPAAAAEPKPRVRKGLSTLPAELEVVAAVADPEAIEPASPKRRGRKSLATEPSAPNALEPDATEPAATDSDVVAPSAPKPSARKSGSSKLAASAAAKSKSSATAKSGPAVAATSKARSSKAASAKAPKRALAATSDPADDALLPADGAKQRRRKGPGTA
jgi:hypothetical protein